MKIEITETHKRIILEALDLYIRAGIGQLESVVNNKFTQNEIFKKDVDQFPFIRQEIDLHVAKLKKMIFNQPLHGGMGLYHPDAPKDAQIAREISCVFEGKDRLTKHEPQIVIDLEDEDGFQKDTDYCPNCDKDTEQIVHFSDHERDSSGDYKRCLTCGWEYSGYTGEYRPPIEID